MASIMPEPAILVGVSQKKRPVWDIEDSLEELSGLAGTLGYTTPERIIQNGGRINPRYLLTKGRLQDLTSLTQRFHARLVIFDDDLAPAQARNLEQALECPVVDRCGLILEIFNQRARSREARTQVQMARLQYLLPRLTGRWSHLSRQRGGIGLREVGESQLELDRRMVRREINKLRQKLKSIERERTVQRKSREGLFRAALTGYTNVGKSTLMNRLTQSNLFVEDKLFATLDACTRTLKKTAGKRVLMTDTVGFIEKLPHSLVASFKATLDEIRRADLLLEMVDLSHPRFEAQMASTQRVLGELGLSDKQHFWVFNKIDHVADSLVNNIRQRFPDSIFVSAFLGTGCGKLTREIIRRYEERMVTREATIDYKNSDALKMIREYGQIMTEKYTERGVLVCFQVEAKRLGLIEKLLR